MGDSVMNEVVLPDLMRKKVSVLQAEISKLPQYEPETKHTFHGGMYCRELFQPAGVLVVGKVHKKDHFYFIASGTVAVTTDDTVEQLTGPTILCSKVGTKRAIYAITDTLYMTIHVVESTTVEAAESELVEDDPDSMFTIGNKVKILEVE
jgi:hypothetical protein